MEKIVLNLKVIPNSKEFKITGFNSQTKTLKVRVKSKPQKGLANKEIEKNFSKIFLSKAKIIFGKKNKNKKILIENLNAVYQKLKTD